MSRAAKERTSAARVASDRYPWSGCQPIAARQHRYWGLHMQESRASYIKSAVCTGWFRIRGVHSSLILCSGRLPKLDTRGEITIGEKLIVRGRIMQCDLGATRSAYLKIGNRVFINQGATVVAHCGIEIGDDSLIGEFTALYDTNHHAVDAVHATRAAPVVIGSNVWLGRNVTVLPGSEIGDHTVVAAGSVVRGYLPARVLAAGNPARPVKELDVSDGWKRNGRDDTAPKQCASTGAPLGDQTVTNHSQPGWKWLSAGPHRL